METNVKTIDGKPHREAYATREQLLEDLEGTGQTVLELNERLTKIRGNLEKGRAAEVRRHVARVIASVVSCERLDENAVVSDLAEVLIFLDSAEYAEEAAHEDPTC